MSVKPVRITLSRRKGFRLQEESRAINGLDAVVCARPGPLGNPFMSAPDLPRSTAFEAAMFRDWMIEVLGATKLETKRQAEFLKFVRSMSGGGADYLRARAERVRAALPMIRGKNLACWCKQGQPCHADVLLEIANKP